ncbi:MAG TPA: hypothetical protein PKE00_06810 [Planctomycetota bacterium]|nr:hypothetical protein [Planctomycetota bacterium]
MRSLILFRVLFLALFLASTAVAQNPSPEVGSTRIDFVARSTEVDKPVVKGNTLKIKVDVQIEDAHHSYLCTIDVTIEVADNDKTPRQIAQEACDAIEDKIADCLADHGQPRADAKNFLRCEGNCVVVKATPPTSNNSGTPEKPKKSYDGKLDQQIQTKTQTTKRGS